MRIPRLITLGNSEIMRNYSDIFLRTVYSDATQLDVELSSVELSCVVGP